MHTSNRKFAITPTTTIRNLQEFLSCNRQTAVLLFTFHRDSHVYSCIPAHLLICVFIFICVLIVFLFLFSVPCVRFYNNNNNSCGMSSDGAGVAAGDRRLENEEDRP